jgi:putative hemolysin
LAFNEGIKISKLNKFYDGNKHLKDVDFLNAILDDLQIKFEIPEEDFKRLPKEGAYITISNHPLGGIDGVLLLINARTRAQFQNNSKFCIELSLSKIHHACQSF